VSRTLVFITQQVDPDHPALGAAVPKITALARRFDEVVVLADSAVDGVLPGNCDVRLFGAPGRLARGRRLVAALPRRPAAVLAHMVPLFAIVAAPAVRPRHVPLLLWFTHWKPTRTLVLAERLSTHVLTVDETTFPLRSRKVVPIGHGIDTDAFACARREPAPRLRALALGRTSPAKGLETIVEAARLADVDLELRGPSLTGGERAERARLEALGVTVEPPLPRSEVPGLLMRKDVLVNNMREGALDKVVYEAAATCLPVVASNRGFADVLPPELRFASDDVAGLAARLRFVAEADRGAIGRALRERVEARHSVEHWADEVARVAAS